MKSLPVSLLAATALLLPLATPLVGQKVVSVQVGAVRSTFSGSDHSHATILGRSVRAALAVPLTEALAVQVNAGYTEKGAGQADTDMRLGYVEFSTLLKASTGLGQGVSGHLLWGPAVGVNSNCKLEAVYDEVRLETDCNDADQNVQPTDIGASIGAGVEVPISGGRYRLSFDVLHTIALGSALGDGQHRNSATTFLLGFGWPMG